MSRVVASMDQLHKPGQEIKVGPSELDAVKVDKRLMANIVSNLLSNAIKFSPENSPIYLKYEKRDGTFFFSIKDSGIGIPEEDQQHLFQRFFRAKNASNIQGTGLGLNIVVKYLELMGGKISCESAIGEGTTFVVEIPQ